MILLLFVLVLLSTGKGSEDNGRLYGRSVDLTDLDKVAQSFVTRKAEEAGRKVSWWDIYGEHQHLRERPQYHRYKVDISTSNLLYDKPIRTVDRPQTVQTKSYINRTNNTISSVITWETRHVTSYTWRMVQGFKATWDVAIKTGIPGLNKPNNKTTVSISTTREQSDQEIKTFSIRYELKVPPHTKTVAEWIITERDQEVPFKVDVFVKGYVAIWFSEKWKGHWLWFFPVVNINDPRFTRFEDGLRFQATGLFRDISGVDSQIEATETSLENGRPLRYSTFRQGDQPVPGD